MTFLLFFILSQHLFAQCWKEVATGTYHTLAIKTDGTLWAWGLNNFGQLGDGTTINKNVPTQIGTDINWLAINAETDNSIALKTDGSLWTWGNNSSGQLGDGNHGIGVNNTIPTHIGNDTDWVKISTGGRTYAIKNNGTLWGWGDNNEGHLGVGNTNPYYTPTQIGSDTWIEINGGGGKTLAIKTNNTLWGWGMNKQGSLAIGPPSESIIITSPTQTGNNTADWAKISVGSCCSSKMIKTDGSLWAMGSASYGNIGTGSLVNVNTPTRVGNDNNWKTVTTENHTCAIKIDNSLYVWGNNFQGQLGVGNTTNINTPFQLNSNVTWIKSISSLTHTVAIDSNGTLYSWGWNNYGQLGDGSTIDKNTITQIGQSCPLGTTSFKVLQNVQVYPNPSNNVATISYKLSDSISIEVVIVNSLGQIIMNDIITAQKENKEYQINTTNYSSGIYLITLKTATESVTVKLIKN